MSPADLIGIPRLRIEPLAPDSPSVPSRHPDGMLGLLAFGEIDTGGWSAPVQATALLGRRSHAFVWRGTSPIETGTTDIVQWRRDAHWLFGAIDLPDTTSGGDLAPLAQQAYRALFETLRRTEHLHLLRVWNYLPRINADGGGLERYRQFNLGRQQAFIDAGQAIFEGAPAACALGTHRGPLTMRFLAGRNAPVPIENPRQISAYHYPTLYGPRTPTFSRAAVANVGEGMLALFISGTASIVGHASVHAGDIEAQTRETLRNLAAIVDAASRRTGARFDLDALNCVVYVRHVPDAARVQQVLHETLGAASHIARHALYLHADVCRSELLVEIEGHLLAPGSLQA